MTPGGGAIPIVSGLYCLVSSIFSMKLVPFVKFFPSVSGTATVKIAFEEFTVIVLLKIIIE